MNKYQKSTFLFLILYIVQDWYFGEKWKARYIEVSDAYHECREEVRELELKCKTKYNTYVDTFNQILPVTR